MCKKIYLFFICFLALSLHCTVITGTIDSDTVWSPQNNPYLVYDIVTITEDATLTIMPGTEVIMDSRRYICLDDYDEHFWHTSPSRPATFYVYGRIIARGTEQDSIIFTRPPNSPNKYWGNFYLFPNSGLSIFEHCSISYSVGFNRYIFYPSEATIRCENGRIIVRNCHFYNNLLPVSTEFNLDNQNSMICEITNNLFELLDNENIFLRNMIFCQCKVAQTIDEGLPPLFAGNTFRNLPSGGYGMPYSVFNTFNNVSGSVTAIASVYRPAYFYKNTIFYTSNGGSGSLRINYGSQFEDPVNLNYIRENQFLNHGANYVQAVIFSANAYAEISKNYFERFDFATDMHVSGKIFNNIFNDTKVLSHPAFMFDNNLVYNGGRHNSFNSTLSNNVIILDNEEFSYKMGRFIENSIILTSQGEMHESALVQLLPDTLRNCIIDFDINDYSSIIDGGNNIMIASEQMDEVFFDFANENFTLAPGSPAIDAGYYTPGYEYIPLDLDGRLRVWNGLSGDNAVIDIGVYEFGSPEPGELMVHTYDAESLDAVNYVLLIFNDDPSDFEFTDNDGFAMIQRPAGWYEVRAQRISYEEFWAGEIEFVSGGNGDLIIPMTPNGILSNDPATIMPVMPIHSVKSYPNPFNPSTRISFTLTEVRKVELSIYNIRGQKVKTLIDRYYQPGSYNITWKGDDANGSQVASGLYLYHLKSDDEITSGKLMLMK
jgi:hypothetical protein